MLGTCPADTEACLSLSGKTQDDRSLVEEEGKIMTLHEHTNQRESIMDEEQSPEGSHAHMPCCTDGTWNVCVENTGNLEVMELCLCR